MPFIATANFAAATIQTIKYAKSVYYSNVFQLHTVQCACIMDCFNVPVTAATKVCLFDKNESVIKKEKRI